MADSKEVAALQEQIDDLQSRVAYQEDLLQSLNNIIASQEIVIGRMQQQLQQNREKIDDVAHNLELSGGEKPPHY